MRSLASSRQPKGARAIVEHVGQADFLHACENVIPLGPPGTPARAAFLAEVRAFLGDEAPPRTVPADLPDLSEREREVLELVAAGMSNEAIAEQLFLSTRTVERRLSNVYAKLRLSGTSARAAAAARFSRA